MKCAITPSSLSGVIYIIAVVQQCVFCCVCVQELELYKEELLSKPAILVVNKMDLPEAGEKLDELMHQLDNQEGKNSAHAFQWVVVTQHDLYYYILNLFF